MRGITNLLVVVALVACGGSHASALDAAGSNQDSGGSDSATHDAPSSSGDPANDGASAYTMMDAAIPGASQGRTVQSTIFLPSTPGPHALVVISPGFQLDRTQYTSYAQHLASWDFVVALTTYAESGFSIDHQRIADDVPAVITWALAQTNLAIDPQRIATAGHSLGGKISILAAVGDPRIKAVVAWDPVDSSAPSVTPEKMSSFTAALAVIGETTDGSGGMFGMPCAPAADNFTQYYAAAPSPSLQATYANADHMDWVDDPTCLICGLCTAGTADAADVHTATKRLDVAWLRKQLFADASMDIWLTSTASVAIVSH
jgi:predicted dienelactone hydrolase